VLETRCRKVRDLASLGRPTRLILQRRRFECSDCGQRFTETRLEVEGKVTGRLVRRLVADVRRSTVRELARRHRLSWHCIMSLVRTWAAVVATQHPGRAPSSAADRRDVAATRSPLRHRVLNGQTGTVWPSSATALKSVIEHHPHRALTQIVRVLPAIRHRSIRLEDRRASSRPGAVQRRRARQSRHGHDLRGPGPQVQ
jgi:hypothetical protein